MSSLWNLGASIVGASAEVATSAATGVGTAVYSGTAQVVNTTADVTTASVRRVSSSISPYIPTDQISSVAQFAYSSTYYVSDNTIRAVQLLPNLLELVKTKETQNISLCFIRIIEKILALLKGDEIIEITKLLMQLARSDATSQILIEIKDLLIELFALLRTSEADALKNQLQDLVEGLQGVAREHKRQEAARDSTAGAEREPRREQNQDEAKEELDNPPSNPQRSNHNLGNIGRGLDETDRELIRAVVWKAPNCATVVKKLAMLDLTEAQATELWNQRLTSEKLGKRKPQKRRHTADAILRENRAITPPPNMQGSLENNGISTLLSGNTDTSV